jgi:hypothetical protein
MQRMPPVGDACCRCRVNLRARVRVHRPCVLVQERVRMYVVGFYHGIAPRAADAFRWPRFSHLATPKLAEVLEPDDGEQTVAPSN